MQTEQNVATEDSIHRTTLDWLRKRGVRLEDIADLVYRLQGEFYPDLSLAECTYHVERVLQKREVQNAVLTGIQLDLLAEKKQLLDPLQHLIFQDESLYGVDEILATSILHIYGSIGMTNYGYIDRVKPGILGRLNNKEDGQIHTFLDDLVGAIAAAAAARLSHSRKRAQDRRSGKPPDDLTD
ncbi:phosphatidylglycerophosphatase A [Planifilum fimeticola]|uniref:Phosphatidylglycerophosphatase A n=1 Tax=Planifilum fimeticola TaxID=201975 RepID=A0A2T0LDT8_9BACL|nr:phosphatidylglycerophosphatase A [Planifilum fimeticola]PRX40247.1 phosphatidylglycerophosphatase A [Planifilum fimeticola]